MAAGNTETSAAQPLKLDPANRFLTGLEDRLFYYYKKGADLIRLPPKVSQSEHSTHKPSSLRQPSQCIRLHIRHSWTARTSSFSACSPHATQANSSAIFTPPFAYCLEYSKNRHALPRCQCKTRCLQPTTVSAPLSLLTPVSRLC